MGRDSTSTWRDNPISSDITRRSGGDGIHRVRAPASLLVLETVDSFVDASGQALDDGQVHEGRSVHGSLVVAAACTGTGGAVAATGGSDVVAGGLVSGRGVVTGGIAGVVVVLEETPDGGLEGGDEEDEGDEDDDLDGDLEEGAKGG